MVKSMVRVGMHTSAHQNVRLNMVDLIESSNSDTEATLIELRSNN